MIRSRFWVLDVSEESLAWGFERFSGIEIEGLCEISGEGVSLSMVDIAPAIPIIASFWEFVLLLT